MNSFSAAAGLMLAALLIPGMATAQSKPPAKAKPRTVMPSVRPAPGQAALRAEAFEAAPLPLAIEIRLLDDSPENLELAARLRAELQAVGHMARGGSPAVLTLETDTGVMLPGEGDQLPNPGDRPAFLGFLRATLDDGRRGVRLWEAEAVYRAGDGNLPSGARAVLPYIVRALGQSVNYEAIRIN
jgi:hypothetical protein